MAVSLSSGKSKIALALLAALIGGAGMGYVGFFHHPRQTDAAWYSAGGTWPYRKQITIDHTKVSGASNLTSFPVLVSRTDPDFKTGTWGGFMGKDDGTDLLFTSSDGSTKIAHEIETYASTTGELVAWVNIAELSPSSATVIYMYYGNAAASDMQTVAPMKTAVWNSEYKGVWHMDETITAAGQTVADSTSNANNATSTGTWSASQQVTGPIGGSLDFTTGDDHLNAVDSNSLDITDDFTLSTWVRFDGPALTWNSWLNKGEMDSSSSNYGMMLQNTDKILAGYDDGGAGPWHTALSNTITEKSVWYHVVNTYNATTRAMRIYIDGNLDAEEIEINNQPAANVYSLHIGDTRNASYTDLDGVLDEVRIIAAVRSADWIATEHNNQSSPGTFMSFGAQDADSSGGSATPHVAIKTATSNNSGWYSTGGTWTNRKMITISKDMVSGTSTLTDFPIVINKTHVDFETVTNGGKVGKDDGTDIFFTDSDGTTKIAHEIEKYASTTGEIVMWVEIPTLATSTDTVIYMYYGNASASDMQTVAPTKTAVWDSNYKGVWHLGSSTSLTNSTAVTNTLTNSGGTDTTGNGATGGAQLYSGTTYAYSSTIPTTATTNVTFEAWISPSTLPQLGIIVANGNEAGGYSMTVNDCNGNSGSKLCGGFFGVGNLASTYTIPEANVWHHMVMILTGTAGSFQFYVDGQSAGSPVGSGPLTPVNRFIVGAWNNVGPGYSPGNQFQGSIDEVRISNTIRSADWIKTEYNNQSSPSMYISLGPQQAETRQTSAGVAVPPVKVRGGTKVR